MSAACVRPKVTAPVGDLCCVLHVVDELRGRDVQPRLPCWDLFRCIKRLEKGYFSRTVPIGNFCLVLHVVDELRGRNIQPGRIHRRLRRSSDPGAVGADARPQHCLPVVTACRQRPDLGMPRFHCRRHQRESAAQPAGRCLILACTRKTRSPARHRPSITHAAPPASPVRCASSRHTV